MESMSMEKLTWELAKDIVQGIKVLPNYIRLLEILAHRKNSILVVITRAFANQHKLHH